MTDFVVHALDRGAPRRLARLGCEVVRERDYGLVGRKMIDLSRGGMQFRAEGDVTLGEKLQVFFRAPFSPIYVYVEAVVSRVIAGRRPGDEGPAYAVQFGELGELAASALKTALTRFPPTLSFRPRRVDYAATVYQIGWT